MNFFLLQEADERQDGGGMHNALHGAVTASSLTTSGSTCQHSAAWCYEQKRVDYATRLLMQQAGRARGCLIVAWVVAPLSGTRDEELELEGQIFVDDSLDSPPSTQQPTACKILCGQRPTNSCL